jgi:type IV secretion system protein VirB5
MSVTSVRSVLVGLLAMFGAPLACAQFAVIDVHAVAHLLTQVRMLEQQLTTAREHLAQAQNEFKSMTGNRGMERLLGAAVRNYLPADWAELESVASGTSDHSAYRTLAGDLQGAMAGMAALTPARLATLAPATQRQITATRTAVAMHQVLMRQALANTSARFASLQQLIDALHGAADQKAVLDLQARIGAEQSMLQNEQTKLQVLSQTAQAEHWALEEHAREQAIAWQGQFATRFQPVP